MKTENAKDLPLPKRMSEGASGLDLYANVNGELVLKSRNFAPVATGVCISIPKGFEAQIRPRSGLAAKHGITCLNSPGTIDSDYRGEIKVVLINHSDTDFVIKRGDRIAQMVICEVCMADFAEVTKLDETARGDSGFGHTGMN